MQETKIVELEESSRAAVARNELLEQRVARLMDDMARNASQIGEVHSRCDADPSHFFFTPSAPLCVTAARALAPACNHMRCAGWCR